MGCAQTFSRQTRTWLAGAAFVTAFLVLTGCDATFPNRVSGVYAGHGGATADLVMSTNSPVGEQDEIAVRMAAARDGSRRDAMLGDRHGAAYLPVGWWEEQEAPRIERPYWIHTSRNAESWSVPHRIDTRREYAPYWVR